ncbi:MAG: oligosaccharide flippase family protein [Chloroflexi bacterium]|nr:oligosaccharide flippase family protein [Chloroflexota bacterium]
MSIILDNEDLATQKADAELARKAAKNTAAMILGRVVTFALNFIATIVLARHLGPTDYGHFVTLFALITLIDFTADIGLGDIAVRDLARSPESTRVLLGAATSLRLGFAIVGIVLTVILPVVLNYPPEVQHLALLAAFTLFVRALSSPALAFRARLVMHYDVLVAGAMRIADTGLIVLVALLGGGLREMILARLVSGLVGVVGYWLIGYWKQNLGLEWNWATAKRMAIDALPVALSAMMIMVYLRADLLILANRLGPSATGLYGATHQILEYGLTVSGLIMGSVFPLLSQFYHNSSRQQFAAIYQKAFDVLMIFIIPMAITTSLFGDQMVVLLFGSAYAPAAWSLRLILWALVAFFFGNVVGSVLIAINWQKLQVITDIVAAVLNILLNLLLIPIWGITGSAVAILITGLFTACVGHEIIRRKTGVGLDPGVLSRVWLAGGVLAGVAIVMSRIQANSGWIISVICGLLAYLVGLLALKVVRMEEIRLLLPARRMTEQSSAQSGGV